MHLIYRGGLAAAALGAACAAAVAAPADLMPEPLEGWTAGETSRDESRIEGSQARRIRITRDYLRPGGGLRIVLNTHDRKGAGLIAYVNELQDKNPAAADDLAAKGVRPFVFGDHQGVVQAAEGGNMSGAALKLGEHGTLTMEGVLDGKVATVAPGHVKAYLRRMDLKRLSAFVRKANASPQ